MRVAGWTYVIFHNGEEEMYDLATDPCQLTNLAYLPEYKEMKQILIGKMNALIRQEPRPTLTDTPTLIP